MKKSLRSKGFTLIELMVVIVILGILVALALPNFISAQDRAKVATVKTNMHTIQTMTETYAVDWAGAYPDDTTQLSADARLNKYWKDLTNPYTLQTDWYTDVISTTTTLPAGMTGMELPGRYRYFIYGADKTGAFISSRGQIFVLSNS